MCLLLLFSRLCFFYLASICGLRLSDIHAYMLFLFCLRGRPYMSVFTPLSSPHQFPLSPSASSILAYYFRATPLCGRHKWMTLISYFW